MSQGVGNSKYNKKELVIIIHELKNFLNTRFIVKQEIDKILNEYDNEINLLKREDLIKEIKSFPHFQGWGHYLYCKIR